MCGIFGYVGSQEAVPIILKGLKRLEYRGYDSAGIAVLNGSARILVRKKMGKVKELESALATEKIRGGTGIGHTRWATHGKPSDRNAHPHLDSSSRIAVVHNGIIENYRELRAKLEDEGCTFRSETDSEVFAHLIDLHYRRTSDLYEAVRRTLKEVRGTYAIGAMHRDEPGKLVISRIDSPLIIGLGEKENFVSSDIPAILDYTKKVIPLENGDVAVIQQGSVKIYGADGKVKTRAVQTIGWNIAQAEKGGKSHFMLKEIFEQPYVLSDMAKRRFRGDRVVFEELKIPVSAFRRIRNVMIVACGTSYHAGMVGRYVLEELTQYPVFTETSSEFRYRDPKVDRHTLVIVISQSGETADTLAALREAKKKKALTLAICNVLGSSIEREADGVIYTYAGPEIAVASTKAYTAQIGILFLLSLYFRKKDALWRRLAAEFRRVPAKMNEFLSGYDKDERGWEKDVREFHKNYLGNLEAYAAKPPQKRKRAPNSFFLYLGRNVNYPSALEGALKLKEISYISAEGYPAGEMKHGPIALIDENPWVVCIAVESKTYPKMISNLEEIKARGGIVIAILTKGDKGLKHLGIKWSIEVPKVEELLSPLIVALPLQLIAFHVAKEFGEEIDQPRNLAKSVTVE